MSRGFDFPPPPSWTMTRSRPSLPRSARHRPRSVPTAPRRTRTKARLREVKERHPGQHRLRAHPHLAPSHAHLALADRCRPDRAGREWCFGDDGTRLWIVCGRLEDVEALAHARDSKATTTALDHLTSYGSVWLDINPKPGSSRLGACSPW